MAGIFLMAEAVEEVKPPPKNMGDVLLSIQSNATKGTAQFINRYRKQLHKTGTVDFDLPRAAKMPPWMNVVIETLRLRPTKWKVVTIRGDRGAKRTRVQWLGWVGFTRRRRI